MGTIHHHAIVVTSWSEEAIVEAYAHAKLLGCDPTPITPKAVNCYRSFLIPPDGSKEGWPESDAGDKRREEWIAFADGMAYEDGSNPLEWVEVKFGDDLQGAEVVQHGCEVNREAADAS